MDVLDIKDRRIIRALDMDARLPVNQLAKKVGLSRESTEYRIQRLKKRGIISGSHTVFDADVVGYRSFRVLLRLNNLSNEQKDRLVRYFVAHLRTWWVASVGGKWDIILNFFAKDATEFNHLLEEMVSRYGTLLQAYEVLVYIDIHDHSRKYILPDKTPQKTFYHPMRFDARVKIDHKDLKIIQSLIKDAQASYSAIAETIGLTRNAVKRRILALQKSRVILGYRLAFHPSAYGRSSYLLLLAINNLRKERERELMAFAEQHPDIIFVVKHIGKYRITCECECEDELKFHALLVEIRDRFKDILTDFEYFPIFYDHKITYFPG